MNDTYKQILFKFGTINSNIIYKEFKKAVDNKDADKLYSGEFWHLLNDFLNDEYKTTFLNAGDFLYRARKINDFEKAKTQGVSHKENTFTGFNEANSKEPPIWLTSEQRCTPAGLSVLYTAKDEYTACAELNPTQGQCISVAKFEVQKELKVLDLKKDQRILITGKYNDVEKITFVQIITQIMLQFAVSVENQNEYVYSQIIADLVRKSGYDGLMYMSSKTGGTNIAIFNCHENFIKFIESTIKYAYFNKYCFYDLNKKEEIELQDEYERRLLTGLNKKQIEKICADIKEYLSQKDESHGK